MKIVEAILKITLLLVFIVAVAAVPCGWVMNIVQLCGCDFSEISVKEGLKIVGVVFAPLGVVMGWIG